MSGNPEAASDTPPPTQEPLGPVLKPSVFISYARRERELEVAQVLERGLREAGVGVWRDESQLLAGQQWPTVLGKALEDCDCLVLLWSEHSAASKHVEREWNAAITLKKVILPFRLDATPLPALLLGSHVVDAPDAKAAVPRILGALKREGSIGERERGGSGTAPARARWMAWSAWAVVLSALMALAVVKSLELSKPQARPWIEQAELQSLAGLIRDEAGDPVANVEVSLPKLGVKATTDATGYFHLEARAEKQATVVLMARKDGYETYEAYATLGNTGFDVTLKKR
jgi:hypothetical protein